MSTLADKIRTVAVYIGLSLLVHLLVLFSLGMCGTYHFTTPVKPLQTVMVDLTKPHDDTPAADTGNRRISPADDAAEQTTDDRNHTRVPGEETGTPSAISENGPVEQKVVEPAVIGTGENDIVALAGKPTATPQPAAQRHSAPETVIPPPLRSVDEFMSLKSEKLSYLISLLGVPVGNVELEAKNENNEVRIALRTTTNAALSSLYPVDDFMETRHLAGNFIITKIRQKEGSFKSDTGFTIFLRDKRVFWIDRMRKRYSNETIPNSEVLDTLSSFYYLRNRPLQIGKTEMLHVYDGDAYATVPVEIVRHEEIRLRNLKKVDSLVVRHIKQKGIFRRTGDMTVWLTNDEDKVPVKMETTTPLGKVAVELISAETQYLDSPEVQKTDYR